MAGIEREFFCSIVGELLRKVIHAVADGKLIEGFNQVIILVYGQATVLPAIRVIVLRRLQLGYRSQVQTEQTLLHPIGLCRQQLYFALQIYAGGR